MNILKEDTLYVLPDDLIEKAKYMSKAYEYLYCIENILRDFIDNHPQRGDLKFSSSVQKSINDRKVDESNHKWMSLRGHSDLYYTDFKDLKIIIETNFDFFKTDFPSAFWITAKIEDMTRFRNLIAHNSYIDKHDLDIIKANFNSIARQIQIASRIKPGNTTTENDPRSFVKGLKNSVVWTKKEAEEGKEMPLTYPAELNVAPYRLTSHFEQVGIWIRVYFENAAVELNTPFAVGIPDDREEGPTFLSDTVLFQIGQYDIDGDGIDEIFVCLLNEADINKQVQIMVHKYFPPAYKAHAVRKENWQLIGNFTEGLIGDRPIIEVENNSITIPRFHRGFYYEWTYVKGQFRQTGSF